MNKVLPRTTIHRLSENVPIVKLLVRRFTQHQKMVLGLFFLFTFVLIAAFYTRIQPPAVLDTYYHLAVGRQVWQTKSIQTTDDFIYSDVNRHYTSTEWLAGGIFYLFVKYLGISGMLVLKVILITVHNQYRPSHYLLRNP